MKKIPVILLLAFFAMSSIYGQIKIGDNPQAIAPTSVLELESNDRVFVITRINTAQMDAIVPNQGAMVYNTDTQCIHYYDGTTWINLCDAVFEIPDDSIESRHIINGGVNGIDIQNGSIGPGKLQNNSVTQDKLSENSVGAFALDNANINLSDFTNDLNLLTLSGDPENDIFINGGIFYDEQPVLDAIDANTIAINNIGIPNLNEVLQQGTIAGNLKIEGLATPTNPADAATKAYVDALGGENPNNELITDAVLTGTNLVITEAGIPHTVQLGSLAGGGSQNLANVLTQGNDAGAVKIINLADPTLAQDAATKAYVDSNSGGGSQNLTQVLTIGSSAGNSKITNLLDPTLAQDAATKAYVDANGGSQNLSQVLAQGTDGGAALIKNILDPVDPQDAATMAYVDAAVTGGGILLDGNLLIGDVNNNPVARVIGGDATISNLGALNINDGAITANKLDDMGANDGQILKWNNTAGIWEAANDATGAPALNSGNIFVGDIGNNPQNVTMSGDATINNTGVIAVSPNAIDTGKIDNNAILLEDLNQNGATDGQILKWNNTAGAWETAADDAGAPALTDGNIFVGGAGNVPTDVAMSGDATIDNLGALTIENDAVAINMLDQMGAADGEILKWNNTAGAWETAADDAGTPALTDGNIFVGGAGNVPTDVSMSGDATIDNLGALTIVDDAIALNMLDQNGATDGEILKWNNTAGAWETAADDAGTPALTDGNIFVGGAGNVPTDVIMSGDATIDNLGALTIVDDAVSPTKIEESATDNQVLTTDGANVVWEDAQNLGSSDLTLSANRTLDLDGNDLLFSGSGGIGIGTLPTDVLVKLRVNGQIRGSTFRSGDGTVNLPAYRFENDANSGMFLAGPSELAFSTNSTEVIRIDATQNVGIGTGAVINANAKLHVNGNIFADNGDFYSAGGIVIAGIPDYVFQRYFLGQSELKSDYDFQSLEEIEAFIKANHHLPGIKSAVEVQKEGMWNLSSSNIQNLEKIEELFLHTIEQENKIKALQSENDTLTDELKVIKKDLEEIKALLKKSN